MSVAEAGDDIKVFESSNVRRTYEVTIANFRMKTKGAKSTTIVNLLSVDNLRFSLEVNLAGNVCHPCHVGVYLSNNSPAIVNYMFLIHEDYRITDTMVFGVKLHVVKAGVVCQCVGLQHMQALNTKIEENIVAITEKLSSLETTTTTKFEALDAIANTIQTCPPARPIPCPECPICLDDMKPPTKIIQCKGGHFICEKCRARPSVRFC